MKPEHRQSPRQRDRRKQTIRLVCVVLAVLVVLVVGYLVGRRLETGNAQQEARGDLSARFEDVPSIEYEGRKYQARGRITTILLLGVDKESNAAAQTINFRNGGQSDFLLLLVIDNEKKIVTPIQIDRDTMAEITILGVLGNVAGTRNAQICLSHGFGDGGKQSSMFTVDAVSKLLLGVPIDFYMTMSLDGIAALNDALGGVTVTLEDDFSEMDPTMTPGRTLTLVGKQAEYYTRARMSLGVTNASRMVRQQNYMHEARDILDEKLQDSSNFAGELFDALEPYLETNMKRGRLINEAWNSRKFEKRAIIQLEGQHTTGDDGYIEFHADPKALTKMVLELFYKKV